MTVNQEPQTMRDDDFRARALKRLRKKRDFHTHLVVFVLVNALIVTIWAVTDKHGFFWPIFPMLGWGFGLAMNAWDVYRREEFTEEQIQREISKLKD